jgi:hypothetical protein
MIKFKKNGYQFIGKMGSPEGDGQYFEIDGGNSYYGDTPYRIYVLVPPEAGIPEAPAFPNPYSDEARQPRKEWRDKYMYPYIAKAREALERD